MISRIEMMVAILHYVYACTTIVLCLYTIYQTVLAIAGFVHQSRIKRMNADLLLDLPELPGLTIVIPARNEAKIIKTTISSMLALNYPADRLEILIMDDASTDETPQILDEIAAENPRVRVIHRSAEIGGRGKAAVLNHALSQITNDFIAIYDADNCPEQDALKILMAHLLRNPELGAAVGKFRTGNRRRNVLTRFINIETLCYQGMLQAGRSLLFGVALLTGTNYIVRRRVVAKVGGWDEEALTEDSELSIRVYEAGYRIMFVPNSVSWEQEPETFKVWSNQRTRWARGNIYVLGKLVRLLPRSSKKFVMCEMMAMFSLPFILLYSFMLSQICAIFGIWYANVTFLAGLQYWGLIAIVIYYVQMLVVLSYDQETNLWNLVLGIIGYYTYCQAWLVPFTRALYAEFIRREPRTWYKTVRFDGPLELKDTTSESFENLPKVAIPAAPLVADSVDANRR